MKKVFLILILLVLTAGAQAAQAFEAGWKNNFGGRGSDVYSSVTAVPGGVVAVGDSFETSFGSGDWADFTGMGSFDAIIVKYDGDGDIVWKNNFGGRGHDRFISVTAASGSVVVVGLSRSDSFGTGDWEGVTGKGSYDAIIVKYDVGGNVIWKNNFGGGGSDQFNSVTMVSGGFVAVGEANEKSFGSGDWYGIAGNGGLDAIIVKYDNGGNVVWRNNFGGSGNDRFLSVTAVPGGIVAVGYSLEGSFGSGDWYGIAGRGANDAIIVKYDYDGNIVWQNKFGGLGHDHFTSVTAIPDGVVAVGWSREDSFGSGDWYGVTGHGRSDGIIVRYDSYGNVVWQNKFGGLGPDAFTSVTAVSGGFIAVGYSHGPSFGNGSWEGVEGNGGGGDAIIVKYDYDGYAVWKNNFGGGGNEYFLSVTAVPDGFVAVGASSQDAFGSGDWAGFASNGDTDATIVKFSR